jgi:fatty acid desaturase
MSNIQKYQSKSASFYPQFGTLRAGLLFIIAGCLLYASQLGYVYDWFWWFTLAWGGSLLIEVVIKLNIPRYRSSITSPLIWGTLLVGFSCHQLYGFEDWWPLALIVIGAGIILKGVRTNGA